MKNEQKSGPVYYREGTLRMLPASGDVARRVDGDQAPPAEMLAEVSFSSEMPVRRYDWWNDEAFDEVLDHDAASVRLGRLQGRGPVLMDHSTRSQVGVIESAEIVDRRGRAVLRFSSNARAMPGYGDVWADVVDGIRHTVSVGYRVHDGGMRREPGVGPSGVAVYRVVDWEPFEISLVPVPADTSVGVGRDQPDAATHGHFPARPQTRSTTMTTEVAEQPVQAPAQKGDVLGAERQRIRRINEAAAALLRMNLPADGVKRHQDEAIASGIEPGEFTEKTLVALGAAKPATGDGSIGLTNAEARRYSVMRALRHLAAPNDAALRKEAEFEIECSRAAAEASDKTPAGLLIPQDVLQARVWHARDSMHRDLQIASGTGGNIVATNLLAGSFIEMLRARLVLSGLGAMVLDGLVGNVAIPKKTATATAYWVAEAGVITESQLTLGQLTLTPKTMGAMTDISRRLLKQSTPAADMLVTNDLIASLARELERVAINGRPAVTATANEPQGILATSGIGSVAGGTNGAAPTYSHLVDLETEVSIDNADVGNLAFLTNTRVRGKLRKTLLDTGSGLYTWPANAQELLAYRAAVTNSVPNTLTKGTASGICSAIIFGNFADLVLAMWGGIDLTLDASTLSNSGALRVVAFHDVDVGVRNPQSFAAMQDALTT